MSMEIKLPKNLEQLSELAYNLWFSWNPDARELYKEIDLDLWRKKGRNPVAFLKHVDPMLLEKYAADKEYLSRLKKIYNRFDSYMKSDSTIFNKNYSKYKKEITAYFSAEYGIHESLPNYAGGLGILSGDHCKTASDLGLPFVAVGLMYKHAYFSQFISEAGEQIEEYNELILGELPITPVYGTKGTPLKIAVSILNKDVYLKIWKVAVGRINLFLLDTNVEENNEEDKNIIHSLYGGSRDTRIKQEIILGIGGLSALRKMDINPSVFHMNEGHSAFLGLERLHELLNSGMDFNPAMEYLRNTTLFTTHTPIAAGNESFEFEMMQRYFGDFWPQLNMSEKYFFDLGRNINEHQHENFSLTTLALNFSYMANGVSKLHSEVSQKMWQHVYPGVPTSEVPISYVTNGIHTESWLNREMIKLFNKYLGENWRNHIHEEKYWEKVRSIPDDAYWNTMLAMKKSMIKSLTRGYQSQIDRYQGDHGFPEGDIYDENALIIGFARRFAPYKRATLLFTDRERIKRIFNNSDKPVQILFSGKAHPQNDAGKALIREVNNIAREEGFKGKVVFIENYSINISRPLTSGVDVWLNNPRRPLEASGTSGQKVPINGGINFSVLDGWWPEGYNGKNGWVIGKEVEYADHSLQDNEDAGMMYDTLENEIIPLFFKRDKNGIPTEWIKMSKESLISNFTKFSTHTMVWNYTEKFYIPGIKKNIKFLKDESVNLIKFTAWINKVKRNWKDVKLNVNNGFDDMDRRILAAGESKEISIFLKPGKLSTEDMKVELTLERQDSISGDKDINLHEMNLIGPTADDSYEFKLKVSSKTDGAYRFNCRVLPKHEDLFTAHDTRLIKWLD